MEPEHQRCTIGKSHVPTRKVPILLSSKRDNTSYKPFMVYGWDLPNGVKVPRVRPLSLNSRLNHPEYSSRAFSHFICGYNKSNGAVQTLNTLLSSTNLRSISISAEPCRAPTLIQVQISAAITKGTARANGKSVRFARRKGREVRT